MPINKADIKLILFDIGGVLIEYENVFKTASSDLNIPVNIFWDSFDKYDREITVGNITPQELYRNALVDNNVTLDQTYDFLNSWVNDYLSIVPTYDFILEIKDKYKVGLFSNIYKGMVPKLISLKLLPDINYAYMFISADVGMQKPERNIYEYIEKTTGFKSSEIVFIDDRDDYLAPAVEMGWNTFKFNRTNPTESIEMLRKILG